jgi:hypothetical protein
VLERIWRLGNSFKVNQGGGPHRTGGLQGSRHRPAGNNGEERCPEVVPIGSQFGEVAGAQAVTGVASEEPEDGR